jgi:hypothetical protein
MDRKPNTGMLFRNDNKQNNPKTPDYRGDLNVAGLNYEVAGWINETPKAGKFIRFSTQTERCGAGHAPDNAAQVRFRRSPAAVN